MKQLLLSFFLLIFLNQSVKAQIIPDGQNVIYVNKNVVGSNGSGSSWENALTELADALKWAKENQLQWTTTNTLKIYVAKGIYYPKYSPRDGANFANEGKDNSFLLVNNVQVYGGFDPANGIFDLSQDRIFTEGTTVLSGDFNNNDVQEWESVNHTVVNIRNMEENAYHVVLAAGTAANPINTNTGLDGFTITGGAANDPGSMLQINGINMSRDHGGGIYIAYASPVFTNLVIAANNGQYGSAVYNSFQTNATYKNVLITKNSGFQSTVYNRSSTAKFINIEISLNGSYFAAAMYNVLSNVVITNATITNNGYSMFVEKTSGAVHNLYSNPVINNSIIYNNFAVWMETGEKSEQRNIYNGEMAVPVITNSYIGSLTPGWSSSFGTDGGSNIVTNNSPFALTHSSDFTLDMGSQAINAGSNVLYASTGYNLSVDKDLAYLSRIVDFAVDMGAYEFRQVITPVTYAKNLTASLQDKQVLLSWTTATEYNSKGFSIERSINGTDFKEINFIGAKGNASEYQLADDVQLLTGSVYYRLAEKAVNGNVSYSNIVSVNLQKENKNLVLYPNPAVNSIAVKTEKSVRIYDMSGRMIITVQPVNGKAVIDISGLSKGVYIVRSNGITAKFIKQ